jgi:hypothetical protein
MPAIRRTESVQTTYFSPIHGPSDKMYPYAMFTRKRYRRRTCATS